MAPGLVAAVDIGATRTRAAILREGIILSKEQIPTPKGVEPARIPEAIAELLRRLPGIERVEAVGVATAGPLDLRRGMVIGAPNMDPGTFEIRDPLGEVLGVRVVVANDCVAAVWGEHVLGSGKGVSDHVYITISTGIGGGAVVDGRLLVGRRGNSHEIGHIVVDEDSPLRCGCGGRGHWEGISGGANLARTARYMASIWSGDRTPAQEKAARGELGPREIYEWARRGDPFASAMVEYLNRIHAAGVASVISVYDPELIHVGGSIFLENRGLILPALTRILPEYTLFDPPPIVPATYGVDAPLIGAAAIALKTPPELARYEYSP